MDRGRNRDSSRRGRPPGVSQLPLPQEPEEPSPILNYFNCPITLDSDPAQTPILIPSLASPTMPSDTAAQPRARKRHCPASISSSNSENANTCIASSSNDLFNSDAASSSLAILDFPVSEVNQFSQQNQKPPAQLDFKMGNGSLYVPLDTQENCDFMCSICIEYFTDPTANHCGHTYCLECIKRVMEDSEADKKRCPKCGVPFNKEKLVPNFAVQNLMARAKRATNKAIAADVFESVTSSAGNSDALFSPPPQNVVKVLSAVNYDKLSLNDLDNLVQVVQRRREVMASEDESYKRLLLQEFFSQLLKVKTAEIDQLQRETALIKKDMACLTENNNDELSSSKEMRLMIENCSKFSSDDTNVGIGFNTITQQSDLEHHSVAARKKRMNVHFDELAQLYFEARNSQCFDNRSINYDATVPNNRHEQVEEIATAEEKTVLANFGKALSHVTQYHGLKPLASLSYASSEVSTSSNNIVSSIEFDKDNEYFAVAGVSKKIKVFDYVAVIGSSVGIHCPTTELSCTNKITCIGWNHYYKNSLISSDYEGMVTLWDAGTSSIVRTFAEHEKRVWSVDWSNGDPRLFVSGSDDHKVKLWSTNTPRSLATFQAKLNVCCVKFCPENTYVMAFGCADHNVHYFDFRMPQKPLGILHGHKKAISYVKFASKNELISASTDNNMKLWNLNESMSCIKSFEGHTNEKNFVGLATDGNYIACGSENNCVYIYSKYMSKPLFSFKFENQKSILEKIQKSPTDEGSDFVSAVSWKRGSPVVIAANSQGLIKIFEMV